MTDPGVQLSMTQKVVGAVTVGLLGWSAYTTQQTSIQVAVLDAKLETATDLRNRVNNMEVELSGTHERMNALAGRITSLEQKQ